MRPRSYQVLGYVILASRDLDEAIERLMRFEKLSGNLGRTERHDEGDQVRLCWRCPVAGEPGRMLTEAAITGWVTFMRPLRQQSQQIKSKSSVTRATTAIQWAPG